MRVTVAQMNPTVGDIDGNLSKIIKILKKSHMEGSDLAVFPEQFLAGYPAKDLLEQNRFLKKIESAVAKMKQETLQYPGTGVLFGTPSMSNKNKGTGLYNSAVLLFNGKQLICQHKSLLPTYDVFDEARYFDPASEIHCVSLKNEMLGISICEDAWNDDELWPEGRHYLFNPMHELARSGASIFINISASPFTVGKEKARFRLISQHAKKYGAPFLYVNQVGGNDELVFDGRSMLVDKHGAPVAVFPSFREHVLTVDTSTRGQEDVYNPQDRIETVHEALILGTRDYMKKCGFKKTVVGLSGGIDSAVTVCLAVRAVGKENVLAISMPSPFSSKGSVEDSKKIAENLGIQFKIIPISDIYYSYLAALEEHFTGQEFDITEENIQARIRGNILMSFCNKYGYLLLSTGNKSELSVGYCTLYGDMSGGLAVISDVPKMMVYELADYINRQEEIIPANVIEKAPSAELKPDQKDEDSLPPYSTLDKILYYYIEERLSAGEIIDKGYDAETVRWIIKKVVLNEYKRKQAAIGLKVTSKAFGVGRRMPIAAKHDI